MIKVFANKVLLEGASRAENEAENAVHERGNMVPRWSGRVVASLVAGAALATCQGGRNVNEEVRGRALKEARLACTPATRATIRGRRRIRHPSPGAAPPREDGSMAAEGRIGYARLQRQRPPRDARASLHSRGTPLQFHMLSLHSCPSAFAPACPPFPWRTYFFSSSLWRIWLFKN